MTDRKQRISQEELAREVAYIARNDLGEILPFHVRAILDLRDSRERVRELEEGIRKAEVIAGRPCAFCVGSATYTKPGGGGWQFHHDDGCMYAEIIRRRKENA